MLRLYLLDTLQKRSAKLLLPWRRDIFDTLIGEPEAELARYPLCHLHRFIEEDGKELPYLFALGAYPLSLRCWSRYFLPLLSVIKLIHQVGIHLCWATVVSIESSRVIRRSVAALR